MTDSTQSWLRTLITTHPALYWPWRHSLRLALITTIPLAIGFSTQHLTEALFVCLGGLLSAISVQTDPYSERFPRIFAAVPFGMAGFVWGSLLAGNSVASVSGVVVVAVLAAWVSFFGKTFSAGALQMLVLTVVAAHLPAGAFSWLLPVLFAGGAVYAAVLLGIEALLMPKQPEKKLVALVFDSLAKLARSAADASPNNAAFKAALHAALVNQANAYSVLMDMDSRPPAAPQGDPDRRMGRQCLALLDQLTVLIATHRHAQSSMVELAAVLQAMAHAVMHPTMRAPTASRALCTLPENADIAAVVNGLAAMFELPLEFKRSRATPITRRLAADWHGLRESGLAAQWQAQRSNFINILSLALCMLIAMLAEFNLPGNRSYWIPLTVAVILKPDFGSVFVRAVQRSLGTLIGVVIAVAIFYAVPKGMWLVAVVGCLSVVLPWASLKNYAWQCTFLTPLILILLDLIITGPTVDYGPQRLIDTVLGALIVLVFGYFIWPKPVSASYVQRSQSMRQAVLNYLTALQAPLPNAAQASQTGQADAQTLFLNTVEARHQAYAEVFALRKWAQNYLGEPPPISQQALSWLPTLDQAEALLDQIGMYAVACDASGHRPKAADWAAFEQQAQALA